MAPPTKESSDQTLSLRRQKTREKVKRHRERAQIELERAQIEHKRATALQPKTKHKLQAPAPTLPEVLHFALPPPHFRASPAIRLDSKKPPPPKKKRDLAKGKVYCARSRLKRKMKALLVELEDTLVELKESKFTSQKRGGNSKKSNFHWLYQFDVYNHSMRHRLQSGYEIDRPGTRRHNIESLAIKDIRVRMSTRDEMLKRLQGHKGVTPSQVELMVGAWSLVEQFVEGIPPLKEWAGKNSDYKVQFSMMANASHAVKPHTDSDDIAPQFSICLGQYSGGELLTWDDGKQNDADPHLSTQVLNKLLFFDGRLKHAVDTWKGEYRINIAFYKHFDSRWTRFQPLQKKPVLVMDFN